MGTIMVFALLCRKKTMMTLFAAGQESLFNTVRNLFLSFLLPIIGNLHIDSKGI